MSKSKEKKTVDKDTLFWWREASIKGTIVYEALMPCNPMPVCSVWARWHGNATVEILNSYTIEPYRMHGYRTWLHYEIIKHCENAKWIMTARGRKHSEPWLKKMGFWQDEITNDWMLEINRKKPKKGK